MSVSDNKPYLHVEGRDDQFTIVELLRRHGLDMSEEHRPFTVWSQEGVEALLAVVPDAIRAATDRPIGFVLDVDVKAADRWKAVCRQLRAAGLNPPSECPREGYLGQLPTYPCPIGVWLMPDCISDHGKLEHLLRTLVPANDRLWPHAEKCTDEAATLGATFGGGDRDKAVTHCWLAWQKSPGVPFGTAISARFLNHDSPEALAFLRWLKRLYGLPGLTAV